MSNELLAFILALLTATIPNLIIKWMESRKPKEELDKTAMEAADISLDMLKEVAITSREHCIYLEERLKRKQQELELLRKENEELKNKLDSEDDEDAIQSA